MIKTAYMSCTLLILTACSAAQTDSDTSVQTAIKTQAAAETAQVPVTSDPAKAKTVHAYTRAFNDRDIDAMLAMATDDVEWISLQGTDLLLGADGALNLRATMESYFESCSSCRASLRWTKTTDERVVALEEASWDADGERKSQSSLSVYEFEDEKIRRVYYYPAE